jgi:ATP-dependent Clp protease adapter protein ClpS
MEQTLTRDKSEIFLGRPYNVILFNDQVHSFDEVVSQVYKAIGNRGKAEEITMEAHNNGRAIVITAHKEKCEMVASILEEINLGVKIELA